ncbi:MAG: hypothetical protein AAGA85_01735 [Bacteroidota bacterium]
MIRSFLFVLSLLLFVSPLVAQQSVAAKGNGLPSDLREVVLTLHESDIAARKKLRKLFFTVKREYLVNHQLSSTYYSTLRGDNYDCVTGTLLYSQLLKVMGFEVTIHEFNHHVLLGVFVDGEEILFDSTDPYGLIKGKRKVAATIAHYKRQEKVLPDTDIYETIQAEQALGLYYFNQSVKHLDTEEIDIARVYANMALRQYPCDRTVALNDLLSKPFTEIKSFYDKGGD